MITNGFAIMGILNLLSRIVIDVVYIVGIILTAVLIRRAGGRGPLYAMLGFILLLLNSLCGSGYNYLIIPRMAARPGFFPTASGIFNCVDALGIILAIGLILWGFWTTANERTRHVNE